MTNARTAMRGPGVWSGTGAGRSGCCGSGRFGRLHEPGLGDRDDAGLGPHGRLRPKNGTMPPTTASTAPMTKAVT